MMAGDEEAAVLVLTVLILGFPTIEVVADEVVAVVAATTTIITEEPTARVQFTTMDRARMVNGTIARLIPITGRIKTMVTLMLRMTVVHLCTTTRVMEAMKVRLDESLLKFRIPFRH